VIYLRYPGQKTRTPTEYANPARRTITMKSIAIVTDSNCGISPSQAKDLGIYMLPMPFFIDEKEYLEDIDMNQAEFFQYLEQHPECHVSTSQPTPESVTTLWDSLLKDYDEIVHIPMSSGLSSSCRPPACWRRTMMAMYAL
jgi:fatty acid-binding protein DegV